MDLTGLSNGELNQGFLVQQLNNPNVSQRDREILFALLAPPAPLPPPHENNSGPPPPPPQQPPIMPNNQLPVPNVAMPSIPQQNNTAMSPDMLRHLYLQAAMSGQKQQLRISPLPNGNFIKGIR